MEMYCLYTITNKVNDRKYIGISKNFNKRKKSHLSDLRRGDHHCMFLQNSFNKHGEDNFEFDIMFDNMSKEKAQWLEEFYLSEHYDNLYNVSKKSSGGDLISYHPRLEELREIQRTNGLKRWNSLTEEEKREHALKTSGEKNGMFGKTHDNEAKRKISITHKGRIHTEEARKNMSNAQLKRFEDPLERKKQSEANKRRYQNPEERRKTGNISRRIAAEKKARGEPVSPKLLESIEKSKVEFVYKGVKYRGWKESSKEIGLSVPTIKKILLDDSVEDSYYITPPKFATEESKKKQSRARVGKKHPEETKKKMSEAGLNRYKRDYRVIMPCGEVYIFANRKYLNEFLIDNYDMRTSTINNLLKSGETWKPKKNIHKKLAGLKIIVKK